MLGDFASLDVQNTYRGSDAYEKVTLFYYQDGTAMTIVDYYSQILH
ncbi:hypothetical protein [Piscirickettsia salmonis]